MKNGIKRLLLFSVLINFSYASFSQKTDSTKNISHFSGTISATDNGISIIPAFSLNKPAAIFNLPLGKGRLSFEPFLGFPLEGKPWSFLFWGIYKLKENGKLTINTGAHYGLAFSTVPFLNNVISTPTITAQRYLAGAFIPNYAISQHVSVGMYYLYSHGLDSYAIPNTNYINIYSSFNNLKLTREFFLNISPQFYYLNLNGVDGFYFTSTIGVAMKNFPVSVSYQMNKIIKTNIAGSPNYIGSASIVYSFNNNYVRHK